MNKLQFWFIVFGSALSFKVAAQDILSRQNLSVKALEFTKDKKYIGWVHLNSNEIKVMSTDSAWSTNLGSSSGGIRSFSFHPHEQKIVMGFYNGIIELWDFRTGACLWTIQAHESQVNDLKISSQGDFIISVSNDKTIRYSWTGNGEVIKTYKHTSLVNAIEFHPSKHSVFVTGDHDGNIIYWRINKEKKVKVIKAHESYIHDLAFFPDGNTLLSSSHDETIKAWSYPSGERTKTFIGHSRTVYSLAIKDADTFASGGFDLKVCIWNLDSEKPQVCLTGHTDYINVIRFTSGGDILSGSRDGTIRRWKQ